MKQLTNKEIERRGRRGLPLSVGFFARLPLACLAEEEKKLRYKNLPPVDALFVGSVGTPRREEEWRRQAKDFFLSSVTEDSHAGMQCVWMHVYVWVVCMCMCVCCYSS